MTTEQIAAEPPSPGRPEHATETEILSRLTDVTQRVRTVIKQRPVAAVLAAVGAGYLVTRLVTRGGR